MRKPHASVPHNPLLAESLYLTRYIERLGTGTGDMIQRCKEAGLPEPSFQMTDGFVLTIWRKQANLTDLESSGEVREKFEEIRRRS